MINPGLVSISFRKFSVEKIIELCAECRLEAVEWGGDVHVPHGDLAVAEKTAELMRKRNLATAAYGSYFRAGEPNQPDFAAVVNTAKLLGAPTIRVWAGAVASAESSPDHRAGVVADLARAVELAAADGITVSTEYHAKTLTDDNASALRLLEEVPGLLTCWQPPNGRAFEYRRAGLADVLPKLTNLHVFFWLGTERRPLEEGAADWRRYFDLVAAGGRNHAALLEFFMNDSEEQMRADAAALRRLLGLD